MKQRVRLFWISLTGSALFAGVASLWIGLRQSVWFDEAYSIMLAKQPIGELVRLTSLDVHPPFYYLALKGWVGLFGWGELALRSLSVVMMVGALVIAVLLLRRMFSARIATIVAPMIALAPLLLRYGFEIRMYAMASLIGIAATYVLFRAVTTTRNRKWWLVVYAVLIALGLYVQYFVALIWIVHVAWLCFILFKKPIDKKKIWSFVAAYVGGALLFAPWLSTFIHQSTNGALAPIGQPLDLEQLSGVLTFNLFYQPSFQVGVGLTALLVIIIATLWVGTRRIKVNKTELSAHWLIGGYIGLPLIVLMVLSLNSQMYTERYISHISLGLIMLLGVTVAMMVARQGKVIRKIAILIVFYGAFVIGFIHLATVGNFNFQRWETPMVKQAAASIDNCGSGSQLITAGPYSAIEFDYYLPNCTVYFVSAWDELGGGYAPLSGSDVQIKDINQLTNDSVIYIYYDNPEHNLPDSYHQVSHAEFGKLNVTEFKRS